MSHTGHPGNIQRKRGTKATVAKYKELTGKEVETLYFISQPIGVEAALNTTGTGDWH